MKTRDSQQNSRNRCSRDTRHRVIDLYQVHWPDFETPIAETARTLEDLRRQGKISGDRRQ